MEEAWAEVDAIRSIYEDEIVVEDRGASIVITKKVRPSDDESGPTSSVVCQFILDETYPEQSPEVALSRPRGLSDKDFKQLEKDVDERLRESRGMPVIFDILQLCGDFFLSHQSSSELVCPICLCPLFASAVITTSCDHYLHKTCMDEHILVSRRELAVALQNPETRALHKTVDKALYCPVCREMVEFEIEPLYEGKKQVKQPRKSQGHPDFTFDWNKWRSEQVRLQQLYEKQQRQGGIIDLEAERQKNLITEHTVVELQPAPPVQTEEVPKLEEAQPQKKHRTHHRPRHYHKKPANTHNRNSKDVGSSGS